MYLCSLHILLYLIYSLSEISYSYLCNFIVMCVHFSDLISELRLKCFLIRLRTILHSLITCSINVGAVRD